MTMHQPPLLRDFYSVDVGIQESLIEINATTYVAGYLLKRCLSKHSFCQECQKKLTARCMTDLLQVQCHFKAFSQKGGEFGSLVVPCEEFVRYILVSRIEEKFISSFKNVFFEIRVARMLMKEITPIPLPPKVCKFFPKLYLLKLFVKVRIFYILKFVNQDLKTSTRRNTKYLKISHL